VAELVPVAAFATRLDAEMAQRLLASFGIESFVSADDAGGAYGVTFGLAGAQVLVKRSDLERAREALKEM
jgi:hypothetical protein